MYKDLPTLIEYIRELIPIAGYNYNLYNKFFITTRKNLRKYRESQEGVGIDVARYTIQDDRTILLRDIKSQRLKYDVKTLLPQIEAENSKSKDRTIINRSYLKKFIILRKTKSILALQRSRDSKDRVSDNSSKYGDGDDLNDYELLSALEKRRRSKAGRSSGRGLLGLGGVYYSQAAIDRFITEANRQTVEIGRTSKGTLAPRRKRTSSYTKKHSI